MSSSIDPKHRAYFCISCGGRFVLDDVTVLYTGGNRCIDCSVKEGKSKTIDTEVVREQYEEALQDKAVVWPYSWDQR